MLVSVWAKARRLAHQQACWMVQVAAVERMLTEVDELPEQFKSAEIVYLSKNCLTSLEVCNLTA